MATEKTRLLVLIDPGHGADDYTKGKYSPIVTGMGIEEDPTVYNNRFREGNFNRLVANELAAAVNAAGDGIKAIVLVPEKQDIGLTTRAGRANAYCDEYGKGNVLLLSVHSNALGNGNDWRKAKGWLALVDDCASAKACDFAGILFDAVKEAGFKALQPVAGRKWYLYKECLGKPARLTILRKTKCPAVMTENFHFTDPDEVRFLASPEGRAQIVKYHLEAIRQYAKKYHP